MNKKLRGDWAPGEAIGEGGQGNVYKTKDANGKPYAIKVVKLRGGDKKRVARIKREIEIIRQLKDASNIVRIYDDNVADLDEQSEAPQEVYYVMGYAPFGSLKHNDFYLNDVEASLRLFREILAGVEQAHRKGIVHRDIKPENILLYPTQRTIAVADFGLGRITAQVEGDDVTESDEVLGPRYFMAPEQYKDPANADERSDIYSLGKVLHYMLTGKGKIFREEIGDLTKEFGDSNPYLPLIQEKLLNKMVTTDPAKRYSSVNEILEVVDDLLDRISGNSRRMIRKTDDDFSYYDVFIEGRRQEFIDVFAKDLSISTRLLELATEELVEKDKHALLDKLKDDLLAKYSAGKTAAAIKAVTTYVESPEDLHMQTKSRFSFAAFYMAKYFENVEAYEEAHQHVVEAIDKEKDLSIQLRYLLLFSVICTNCKCTLPHDFDARLLKLLQTNQDKVTKARLYKMLGDHYMKNGDKAKGLRYVEAYLALKPHDTEVRFECAWEYSEVGRQSLAMHHYYLHEKTSKKPDKSVENNMAVLLGDEDFSAHIRSMELYRQAYEHGNTLAGSNIASRYISIGLVGEAENILRKIIAEHPDGDYDKRVDRILGSIETAKETEKKTEADIKEAGTVFNRHHSESVRALSSPQLNWVGYWGLNIGPMLKIEQGPGGLTAQFREREAKSLGLKFEGNVATIENFEVGNTIYKEGVLYLTSENELRGYVQFDERNYKEVVGNLISDIQKYDEEQAGPLNRLLANLGKNPL